MNLNRLLTTLLVLSYVALGGCDIPERPVLKERTQIPKRNSGTETTPNVPGSTALSITPIFEPPAAPLAERFETWNAYYNGGKHIGFAHVLAERLGVGSDAGVRYTIDDHLLLRGGQSTVAQRLHHESIEDATGQLKEFTEIHNIGPLATRFTGSVENGELIISTQRGVTLSTQKMTWEPSYRGFVAIEQSLRQTPIRKDEVRMLQTLLPVQHRIATVRLYGGKRAAVSLLDGSTQDLLETTCRIGVGENTSPTVIIWTNESGTSLKSYTEAIELLTFHTDVSTATAGIQSDPSSASGAAIRVSGTIKRPNKAKRTALVVRILDSKQQANQPSQDVAAWKLAPAPGQAIRSAADGSLQVLISSEPISNQSNFVDTVMAVTDADTQPSPLIDFNAELVRRIHTAASIAKLGERETALEMTRTVKGVLEKSPHSLGLTRASEVALKGVADSTGHAVLLAALLRASNIPARIVVGLVYDDALGDTMKYHAWTAAYIDGAWWPLDATLGSIAPANRLALLTNDFSTDDVEQAFLNLVGQLGKLQIEIGRSQY